MELYIARFADDSYQVVIKADSYESAREKAIQYIKTNHTWFESDYNFNGLDIALLDEDYVIEQKKAERYTILEGVQLTRVMADIWYEERFYD